MGRRRRKPVEVGQLVVLDAMTYWWIREPLSGLRVAGNFPTEMQAIMAAKEMDEIADWYGVVKAVALGNVPNCRAVAGEIAERFGGQLGGGPSPNRQTICQNVVAKHEMSSSAN